jgi:SAM-dependent methyltransferase
MRKLVPWWTRIGAKLLLSRLPTRYALWRSLNIFAHGAMRETNYALGVFQRHFAHSGLARGQRFAALELGPGDSLSSAVIAAAYGAARTYLVDAGEFATSKVSIYRETANRLLEMGLKAPDLADAQDVKDVLSACGASYGVRGLKSLAEIPSESVDFIWSHAVLEHVRRRDFKDFIRETRRILRPSGVCSHQIDLQDHLGGALNNMRIPSRWWEADWMARSGFYTNRLRKSEMMCAFSSAGFAAKVISVSHWENLPTPRRKLAREFDGLESNDLLVKEFHVLLTAT